MKILVINGSPKKEKSVTYQYCKFAFEEFDTIDAGKNIVNVTTDVEQKLTQADLIVFSYGVYTSSVPYQLLIFMEEINNRNYLKGKYATIISTSMHFYDHIAQRVIADFCSINKINFIPGFLAETEDLLNKGKHIDLLNFKNNIIRIAKNHEYIQPAYTYDYKKPERLKLSSSISAKSKKKSVYIITDNGTENLKDMILYVKNNLKYESEIIDISKENIKGGCLGCLKCTINGTCVYKDDHENIYNEKVFPADGIIYAASIESFYFNSNWKKYYDRLFSNGHRTSRSGKQMAYIISGNLEALPNLRDIIISRAEVSHEYLAGIVTDENSNATEKALLSLCRDFEFSLDNCLKKPSSFLGVGGMKIFRDLVYLNKGFMIHDHKFFKKNKLYDFPHNKKKELRIRTMIGFMIRFKGLRKIISETLPEVMLKPYYKVLLDNNK